ncbi:MAG TPA: response regulator [Rudaea sp.]|jgi:two-component system response regulator BaeR|nr:response regulator [Rudaea sp.]
MSQHILVVEDEPKIAALLRDYLVNGGYEVTVIDNGAVAADWVREHTPDAVLLDVMLPAQNGLDVCKSIRRFSDVPILMVTARVEEIDRLLGLELGADDYICKPFSPREVVARVKAVLRRIRAIAQASPLPIELDETRFEIRVRGQALSVTPVEFRLLKKLLAQPGRVFSRQQLMDAAYRDHRIVSDRTVDSHVKNLRRKLADAGFDPITSVYGVGYRLELIAE